MDMYALGETERRRLEAVGAFLRSEFGEGVLAPEPDSGGRGAFRFDVQTGEGVLRLWVTLIFLMVAEGVTVWLAEEQVARKLRESGSEGSVVLTLRGDPARPVALVSAERVPGDLLPE